MVRPLPYGGISAVDLERFRGDIYGAKKILDSNSFEIKQAVEELFKVKVLAVTTSVVKGKTKRNRTGTYKRSNYKKAFVTLSQDSEIQFEGIN